MRIFLNLLGFVQWWWGDVCLVLPLYYHCAISFSGLSFISRLLLLFQPPYVFLLLCCIFYFVFSQSVVLHSFSAQTSVGFSCFFLSLPYTLSFQSTCRGGSEIPSEVEWPQEEKNLALRNEPTPFFLKSKKSGQHTFPCILLLLPSIAAGLHWN